MNQAATALTAELEPEQRVAIGLADEVRQAETLRANGFVIEEVTHKQDTEDKIDRFLVIPDGTRESLQIKGRDPNKKKTAIYKDILVCTYEPFCGVDNEFTEIGRDIVSKYQWFTCRILDQLYLISGRAQKALLNEVLDSWMESEVRTRLEQQLGEWLDKNLLWTMKGKPDWKRMRDDEETEEFFRDLPLFTYSIGESEIKVQCTRDKNNRRPKVLTFIPPTIYTPKQARKYTMI